KQYFSFQWHITDECDQRCKHCYIFSGEGCKELKSMTWKQMQEVVANCEDFCKVYHRVPYFYITGGDPILHPDFWELMVLLKSKGIPFTLMGNPFHLDDEICRMLKVCGCEKYQMSLDGMRETHDWFRKPGSFDLTLEKVGCLNRAGITSVIMSTVSKTNMNEIPDIIDAVVNANVKIFAFSRYVPTGGEVDTSMTPQEYRNLLESCDAKYKAYEAAGCKTYFNKKDHLWTLYEYETGQFSLPDDSFQSLKNATTGIKNPETKNTKTENTGTESVGTENVERGNTETKDEMIYGGCNCGNCHITISSNGDIMACRRVTNSKVANVFEDRLADVWICQMEKYRDFDKFKKCSKCELKAWCRGCPAVANGTSGDFYGTDPQCWKTRNELTGESFLC
ncbi:radical SAM/SPASM domain protein, ACGX system, partial [Brotaphodocola sp.]|uniref:radical SAM/SPASM domain protein, ACGX system n=1 Tax=Brotaphodocola sp. TaxID=3073577 RepID=UPI003D7F0541